MKRVDIEGQDGPKSCKKQFIWGNPEPFRVNHNQICTHEQPSNYIIFCNEVDSSLQKLGKTKALEKKNCYVLHLGYYLLIMMIPFVVWLLSKFMSVYGICKYTSWVFALAYLIYLMISCSLSNKVSTLTKEVYKEVSEICKRYSVPNNVTYELCDESSCGARRRFLMVDVIVTNDIEHQPQLFQHEQMNNLGIVTPENFDDHE